MYDFQRKHGHDVDCHVVAPASTCSNTRASTFVTTRASTCVTTRASTCITTRASMVLAHVVIHVLARVIPHVLARVLLHVLARVIIHVHDYYLKTCGQDTHVGRGQFDQLDHPDHHEVKQQEALEDLSTQLKPLLGDSGMMDSNLVGSLVPR